MKKLGKVLSLLLMIFVLTIALTTNVKAAETVDLTGYNEIGGDEDISTTTNTTNTTETTTNTTTTTPTTTTTTTETKPETKAETVTETKTETKSDVATTGIAQTGSTTVTVCIVAGSILVIALGIGYAKMKKYSF